MNVRPLLPRPAVVPVTLAALAALVLTAGAAAAVPAAATVPGAPTAVTATAGSARATVTWNAPASNGGSAITGYRATCASSTGGATGTASVGVVLTTAVTGLTNGKTYTCTVQAVNAVGTGAASTASAAVVPVGPPTAPRSVTVKTVSGTLTATWKAPSSTGGKPIGSYAVSCTSTDGGAALNGTATGTATSKALTGLAANRTYRCSVTATGPGGTGPAATSPYAMHAVVAAGGTAAMHLPVTAAQRFSVVTRATTMPGDCTSRMESTNVSGVIVTSTCTTAGAFDDGQASGGAGTATGTLTSEGASGPAGSAELVGYVFSDLSSATTIGTAAVTTTTVPGQDSRVTFPCTAGQQVTVTLSSDTIPSGSLSLLDPAGTYLSGGSFGSATGFVDTVTVPSSGTCTMLVDPYSTGTGSVSLKVGLVPPNTGTISLGTATTLTIGTPGQNALRTFSGTAGQMLVATVTGNTVTNGTLNLLTSTGSYVAGVSLGGATAFLDTATLPAAGTYQLVLDPYQQDTGTLTVKLQKVAPNTGTTTPGSPTSVTASIGQNPSRTFSATAGQAATIAVSSNTIAGGTLTLTGPGGAYVASLGLSGSTGLLDQVTLTASGTYTVTVDPYQQNTGSLTFKVTLGSPNTGGTTLGGPAITISAAAGQNPVRTFTANAGQRFTATISSSTVTSGYLEIYAPDGGYLGGTYLDQPDEFIDLLTIPTTGTYEIRVDPYDTVSTHLTVKTDLVPDNTGTIALGTATTITVGTIGQNPTRTFSGTTGQQVTMTLTGNTIDGGYATINAPDGTYVSSGYLPLGDSFVDTATLPATGTYTLTVDPNLKATGKVTVKIGNVPANTGTITPGSAQTITAGTVGQNPTRTFSGTAGQQVVATVTANTVASGYLTVYAPNGDYVGSTYLDQPSEFIDTLTLPAAGTYTLTLDPLDQNTGQLTVKLATVPANTGTIAVGTAQTVTAGAVGQNPTRTFSGSAGQQVTMTLTGNTIDGGYATINASDGTYVTSGYLPLGDSFVDTATLPAAGTYTLTIDPSLQTTGSVTVKLGNVPANTGTITPGTAQTITAGTVGQNPRRTFSGTAGKQLSATVTGNTVASGYLTVYAPDGTYVTSTYVSDSTATLPATALPASGTYVLVLDPVDQNTGQLTIKLTVS